MKKITFFAAALCTMLISHAGMVTYLKLDCQPGVRTANNVEQISFSPAWETPDDGANVEVAVNGVVLTNATESGVLSWKPEGNGDYTFTHEVFIKGVKAGETLSAQFEVAHFPQAPTISPASRTIIEDSLTVSIACATEGATIYYTTNGTQPTAESQVYARKFRIYNKTRVRAFAVDREGLCSAEANAEYAFSQCADPVITAASTGSKAKVSISCATPDATIRYTTNGTDPNSQSTKYTEPFEVTDACTIKAYAVLEDYLDSAITAHTIEEIWAVGDSVGAPDQMFASSGDFGWVRDTAVSKDGSESVRSGAITNNQKSVLSTTVKGNGTISFWWKTSCEADELHEWDRVECKADGTLIAILDGITDWKQVTHTFTTDSDHTITWEYIKDDVEFANEDCAWVDAFVWTPADPIPEIPENATKADIEKALEGSADARLTDNITTVANYNAYRAWSQTVTLPSGELAGMQAVKDSQHSWLSFALDSAVLLQKAPEQGEMTIAAFTRNDTTGKFDFAVELAGISAGTGALAENLAKVFELRGAPKVDDDYLADNVVFTFGTPVDGKVVISALPKDETATQFFMKVKMK